MEIEDCFDIVYQLHRVDGIERYCSHMDMGPAKRDKILDKEQYIIMRAPCCGFDYQLTEQTGLTRYSNSYRARKNYRELTLHNGICRSSLEISGNKIIHTQNGKKHIVTIREFYPDRLVVTINVDKTVTLVKHYVAISNMGLY